MYNLMKPYQDYTDQCLRCGICLAHCPIYNEYLHEGITARGKIRLFKELFAGRLYPNPRFQHFIDMCLGCRACTENCPTKIPVAEIIYAARAQFGGNTALPLAYILALSQIRKVPDLEENIFATLGLIENEETHTKATLISLQELQESIPPLPSYTLRQSLEQRPRKTNPPSKKVAYFPGCMTNLVYPQIGIALIKVLEARGYEILIPPTSCCGYHHYSSGNFTVARELAYKNIRSFNSLEVEWIITDCGSCGNSLKNYSHWLRTDDQDIISFSSKVKDITQFIIDEGIESGPLPLHSKVTYHDSCNLNRGMGISKEPRLLLTSLPGIEYKELPESNRCCGGAGSFNVEQPHLSRQILQRKMNMIKETGADTLAIGCSNCRLQLSYGIGTLKMPIRVVHPIELMAESLVQTN